MRRPNKKDYLTTNQFDFNDKLNEYHEQLEKYVDYMEEQLNIPVVMKAVDRLSICCGTCIDMNDGDCINENPCISFSEHTPN